MKIFYDYQILIAQKYGGISRYFYEIISRMRQKKDCSVTLKVCGNRNYYFHEWYGYGMKRANYEVVRRINQLFSLLYLLRPYDIIHPTYYSKYILNHYRGKLVITVHDMIPELYQKDEEEELIKNKRDLIRAADWIIAISNHTKKDILEMIPDIDENKISVIYHSTTMKKYEAGERPDIFPAKYILFVGQRAGYKNFERFCRAMEGILKKDPAMEIVCIGGGKFSEIETELIGDYQERYHQINCNDEMISAAYTFAECFVFPSEYEGFGIPTLEAFACDCPVALSNSSSMPEVGGDAVVYFNPKDTGAIADAVLQVIGSDERRRELIQAGRRQLKKFDWSVAAEKTYECYRRAMEE